MYHNHWFRFSSPYFRIDALLEQIVKVNNKYEKRTFFTYAFFSVKEACKHNNPSVFQIGATVAVHLNQHFPRSLIKSLLITNIEYSEELTSVALEKGRKQYRSYTDEKGCRFDIDYWDRLYLRFTISDDNCWTDRALASRANNFLPGILYRAKYIYESFEPIKQLHISNSYQNMFGSRDVHGNFPKPTFHRG